MGVTLHYKGKLKSTDLISELTHEVSDICRTNNWKFDIFDDSKFFKSDDDEETKYQHIQDLFQEDDEDAPDPALASERKLPDIGLRGILFNLHPEAEPVTMLFNEKGVLNSIFSTLFPEVQGRRGYPWCFTKTQFAGIEAHIQLVNLLQYLGKKYFIKFHLEDDGGYFPKKDRAKLEHRMSVVNNAIGTLEEIFENNNFEGSPDEVISQIQDALTRSLKDIDIQVVKLNNKEGEDNADDETETKPQRRKKK